MNDKSKIKNPKNGNGESMKVIGLATALMTVLATGCAHAMKPDGDLSAIAQVADCASRDSDGDGVNDCKDRCPDSRAGEVIGPDGCVFQCGSSIQPQSVTFESGITLSDRSRDYLAMELEVLRKNPLLKLELVGHDDRCSTPAQAQRLGLQRAQAVRQWLISNGLAGDRITAVRSVGSTQPFIRTTDRKPGCDVEANRRVDRNVKFGDTQ